MNKGAGMENSSTFDEERFKQVLHYIISKSGTLDNVGKTVLCKMMYFSDFDFYELNKKSITGETYVKLAQGPVPKHFDEVIVKLKNEGKITEFRADRGGYKNNMIRFASLKEPEISLLNAQETELITRVVNKLSNMSATQVSAYSHEDMPWKATKDKEEINYKLVFYRTPLFSVANVETSPQN